MFGIRGSDFACQPTIDGVWAGASTFPSLVNSLQKEGVQSLGYNANNMIWSTTRVYTGIASGLHTFAVQCWGQATYGAYAGTGSALASLTVIEIR